MKQQRYNLVPWLWVSGSVLAALLTGCGSGSGPGPVATQQELGRRLFFDERLSSSGTMSCATCHSPDAGFADPRKDSPVSHGAIPARVGDRNAPSAAYAAYSPSPRYFDPTPLTGNMMMGWYVGGQFWDGRADSLEDQAKGPLLNPVEMNNADAAAVVSEVRSGPLAGLFREVFGSGALNDVQTAFNHLVHAMAQYERSSQVCRFSSKYDRYVAGSAELTPQEARGLALFKGSANCVECHSMDTSLAGKALFTTYGYQNLGTPKTWASLGSGIRRW